MLLVCSSNHENATDGSLLPPTFAGQKRMRVVSNFVIVVWRAAVSVSGSSCGSAVERRAIARPVGTRARCRRRRDPRGRRRPGAAGSFSMSRAATRACSCATRQCSMRLGWPPDGGPRARSPTPQALRPCASSRRPRSRPCPGGARGPWIPSLEENSGPRCVGHPRQGQSPWPPFFSDPSTATRCGGSSRRRLRCPRGRAAGIRRSRRRPGAAAARPVRSAGAPR